MIFHFVEKDVYESSIANGYYENPTLKTRGFIHSVTFENINIIAKRYLDLEKEVVILVIDADKLMAEIKYEESKGVFYPHIYGKINVDAIINVLPFLKDEKNNFIINREIIANG